MSGSGAPPRALPSWLKWVVSLAVSFHLFALVIVALSARSGPWMMDFGPSPAEPPQFAAVVNNITAPYYLLPIHMDHNYRFESNMSTLPAVYMEIQVRDANDSLLKTITLPDKDANYLVRHRQRILAENLRGDQPAVQNKRNVIPAPNQTTPDKLFFYNPDPQGKSVELYRGDELPPGNEWNRPSDWSLALVKSYARYIKRTEEGEKIAVLRHHRSPVMPAYLFWPQPGPPESVFQEFVTNFRDGEQPKYYIPQ